MNDFFYILGIMLIGFISMYIWWLQKYTSVITGLIVTGLIFLAIIWSIIYLYYSKLNEEKENEWI